MSFLNFTLKLGALPLILSSFPSSNFNEGAVSFACVSCIFTTHNALYSAQPPAAGRDFPPLPAGAEAQAAHHRAEAVAGGGACHTPGQGTNRYTRLENLALSHSVF